MTTYLYKIVGKLGEDRHRFEPQMVGNSTIPTNSPAHPDFLWDVDVPGVRSNASAVYPPPLWGASMWQVWPLVWNYLDRSMLQSFLGPDNSVGYKRARLNSELWRAQGRHFRKSSHGRPTAARTDSNGRPPVGTATTGLSPTPRLLIGTVDDGERLHVDEKTGRVFCRQIWLAWSSKSDESTESLVAATEAAFSAFDSAYDTWVGAPSESNLEVLLLAWREYWEPDQYAPPGTAYAEDYRRSLIAAARTWLEANLP